MQMIDRYVCSGMQNNTKRTPTLPNLNIYHFTSIYAQHKHQQFQDYATRQLSFLVTTKTQSEHNKYDMKIHVNLMCVCVCVKYMLPYLYLKCCCCCTEKFGPIFDMCQKKTHTQFRTVIVCYRKTGEFYTMACAVCRIGTFFFMHIHRKAVTKQFVTYHSLDCIGFFFIRLII